MAQDDGKLGGPGGPTLVLVGQPNVGKSVIFGRLTGKYAVVSNYPGTTVEVTTGHLTVGDRRYTVIDTPGVNSIHPHSEDERVTRDILIEREPDVIVQVADAKNLSRALSLTSQLLERGRPLVLCLNMMDEAEQAGVHHRRAQAIAAPRGRRHPHDRAGGRGARRAQGAGGSPEPSR